VAEFDGGRAGGTRIGRRVDVVPRPGPTVAGQAGATAAANTVTWAVIGKWWKTPMPGIIRLAQKAQKIAIGILSGHI
jgi:hypothetical protein